MIDSEHYAKKHKGELAAVLANLDRYMELLKCFKNAACVKAGFLHTERKGVLAIDQKGRGRNLQQTRLYLFAEEDSETVHLITIGNKGSQNSDVVLSHRFVDGLHRE